MAHRASRSCSHGCARVLNEHVDARSSSRGSRREPRRGRRSRHQGRSRRAHGAPLSAFAALDTGEQEAAELLARGPTSARGAGYWQSSAGRHARRPLRVTRRSAGERRGQEITLETPRAHREHTRARLVQLSRSSASWGRACRRSRRRTGSRREGAAGSRAAGQWRARGCRRKP